MKNSNDSIVNRTRDLPTCVAVPQSTALLRAPYIYIISTNIILSDTGRPNNEEDLKLLL